MWSNKEDNNAGWLLPVFLHKLTMDKNKLIDKINQLLVSQDTVAKEMNELNGTVGQLQTHINNLKISKYALEEKFLSSIHRTYVAGNQSKALII